MSIKIYPSDIGF